MATMQRDYITTMDPEQRLGITDEHIRSARPFEGHGPDYLSWPDHLWKDKSRGVPNEEIEKNAYHILYLADIMRREGRWIGPPLRLWDGDTLVNEGNHRFRAVKFLRAVHGVEIEVPIDPERVPRPAR